eukprot:748880-Hanusia_phi.AAC.7
MPSSLCFNGPPGVGKTSIGKAIAAALNRKFFRFSVGGLSDVSEIKGHRRTYVGGRRSEEYFRNCSTSNDLSTVADPLKDRMEIIQVSGYAIQDKIAIAMNHLLPKGREDMGLTAENSHIHADAMFALINKYCREPGENGKGIENLSSCICKVEVTCGNLESFIGAPLFPKDKIFDTTPEMTGKMGEVMKESAEISYSVARK